MPFLLLQACREKAEVSPVVTQAERVMVSSPDSALSILEYYCEPTLTHIKKIPGDYARAKYALLYTQALDENKFFIGSDSIIKVALNFYGSNAYSRLCRGAGKYPGSRDTLQLDKAKSFYYLGRIFENGKKYEEAISAYLDAAALLDNLERERILSKEKEITVAEFYLRGRVYGVLAKLLREQYSLEEAFQYYRKSAEAYKKTPDLRNLLDITEGMAVTQYYMDRYQGALGDYNNAIKYAAALNDTSRIISLSRGMAALVFHFTGGIKLTKEVLVGTSEKYGYTLSSKDYPLLASVYLKEGRINRAQFFFNKSLEKEKSFTPHQKIGMYAVGSTIEAIQKNYEKAYGYSRKMASIADSLNKSERRNLVVELMQKYRHRQQELERAAREQKYNYMSVIYILGLVILGLLIAVAVIVILAHKDKIRLKNREIEEYLQQLNAMEVSRNNIMGTLDSHVEKEALLKELLQTRFAEVKELARIYYEYGYSKNLQKKVEEILSVQLLQGESFEIIEKIINAQKNGAIEKIRREFPGLKEENIKLLCLLYAGFSPQELCAVLNDTPQNIYVKKYRLKNKLAGFIRSNPGADF